jgi:hypothetical protein
MTPAVILLYNPDPGGSTRITLIAAFCSFKYFATPAMVPPVPDHPGCKARQYECKSVHASNAHFGARPTSSHDKRIYLAVGLPPNLGPRPRVMCVKVGQILKLVREHAVVGQLVGIDAACQLILAIGKAAGLVDIVVGMVDADGCHAMYRGSEALQQNRLFNRSIRRHVDVALVATCVAL